MQFNLVLLLSHFAFVIIVTVHAVPPFFLEPGITNNQYVDETSRWVTMAGEVGVPILVDLLDEAVDISPSVGSLNQYWLYTRSNRDKADILVFEVEESVIQSNYKYGQPLVVLAHGWRSDGTSEINTLNTAAFLDTQDVNVIVVDWSHSSKRRYIAACAAVPFVGEHVGKFVSWLLKVTGTNANKVHLAGHSLGAHVVGNAGVFAKGMFARITGLDPAGPRWRDNPKALNTSAALYVETINTDGKRYGIFYPLGHANFYPNRGKANQPGCITSVCSHSRAGSLFAATVCYNRKIGKKCKNLGEAENGTCNGAELPMGNGVVPKTGEGLFGLTTGSEWPY